ncbi:hypothetical protein ABT124_47925 [Streptomyces sp. NPDC001982]|uniref:hypothetical protein n=1 Tax=unclassified Streptomyces TaxID=2593676 RepID=UPI003323F0C6
MDHARAAYFGVAGQPRALQRLSGVVPMRAAEFRGTHSRVVWMLRPVERSMIQTR